MRDSTSLFGVMNVVIRLPEQLALNSPGWAPNRFKAVTMGQVADTLGPMAPYYANAKQIERGTCWLPATATHP